MKNYQNIIWIVASIVTIAGIYPIQRHIARNFEQREKSLRSEIFKATYDYQVNKPDTTFYLTSSLNEISGLTLSPDQEFLLAVQDEQGIIFWIDKTTGEISRRTKFANADDYEGIEVVGKYGYISNSKGTIDKVDLELGEKVETFKTFLNSDHDVEGLGYIKSRNSLLVACKSYENKKDKDRKVYRFDLQRDSLLPEPFYSLDRKEIRTLLGREKGAAFAPSAIGTSPDGTKVIVMSSTSSAILTIDLSGKIHSAVELSKALHRQPEGITVDRHGVMYIANEGQGGVAKIHVFKPIKKG